MTNDPSVGDRGSIGRDRPARRRFVCRPERGSTRRTADESEGAAGSHGSRSPRLAGARRRLGPSCAALGWTDGQIDHEIKYGRWHAPAWGVVALQNAPLTYDQRLWLGSPARWGRCGPHSPDLVPTGRPGVEGGRRTRSTCSRPRATCRPDRGLLLPPDQTALRPVGASGAVRTSAAADRALRPVDRRARSLRTPGGRSPRRVRPAAAHHRRPADRHRAADPEAPARRRSSSRCSTTSRVAPSRSPRSTSDACARVPASPSQLARPCVRTATADGDTWTASGSCPTVDWSPWRWTAPSTCRSATGGAT